MIEVIIGMGGAIAALLAIVFAMRSKVKSQGKRIKSTTAVIKAGHVAREAIDTQVKEEEKNEEANTDSIARRDYFSK